MTTSDETSGVFWYLNLSPKQTEAVQQLRAALRDCGVHVHGQGRCTQYPKNCLCITSQLS